MRLTDVLIFSAMIAFRRSKHRINSDLTKIIIYGWHVSVQWASVDNQGTRELWIVKLELLLYIFLALSFLKTS